MLFLDCYVMSRDILRNTNKVVYSLVYGGFLTDGQLDVGAFAVLVSELFSVYMSRISDRDETYVSQRAQCCLWAECT